MLDRLRGIDKYKVVSVTAVIVGLGVAAFSGCQGPERSNTFDSRYDIEAYSDGPSDTAPEPSQMPTITAEPQSPEQKAEEAQAKAEAERANLNIAPSPIVAIEIPKLEYAYPVESYSIADHLEGNKLTYNPNGMMTVNAINEPLGINTDGDPKTAELIFGQLGIKEGEQTSLIKVFGHNNSTGPGAFNRLQELNEGDLIQVTTENGAKYTFKVVAGGVLSKDNHNSLETAVGPSGQVFSCRTEVVNGKFQRTSDYVAFGLRLAGVTNPDDNKSFVW